MGGRGTASVQHQNVDRTEGGGEPVKERIDGLGPGQIERKAEGIRTDFRRGPACGLFVPAGQGDRNAFGRKRFGDTAPKPLAAAQNKRFFAFDAEIHGSFLLLRQLSHPSGGWFGASGERHSINRHASCQAM